LFNIYQISNLPSAGSAPSLHHSPRIHNTSLPPDGSKREKYEGEVFRSTDERYI